MTMWNHAESMKEQKDLCCEGSSQKMREIFPHIASFDFPDVAGRLWESASTRNCFPISRQNCQGH